MRSEHGQNVILRRIFVIQTLVGPFRCCGFAFTGWRSYGVAVNVAKFQISVNQRIIAHQR